MKLLFCEIQYPQVLEEHTPKNITIKKRVGGPKLPEGAARYLPTSPEHIVILEERAAKSDKKLVNDKKVVNDKNLVNDKKVV